MIDGSSQRRSGAARPSFANRQAKGEGPPSCAGASPPDKSGLSPGEDPTRFDLPKLKPTKETKEDL